MPAQKLRMKSHVLDPKGSCSKEMLSGAVKLGGRSSRRSSGRTTSLAGRDVSLPKAGSLMLHWNISPNVIPQTWCLRV